MINKLSEIVPKALLPITVLLVGFLIIALSLILTRLVMKIIPKKHNAPNPVESKNGAEVNGQNNDQNNDTNDTNEIKSIDITTL